MGQSGKQLTITQSSERLAIDWQSFSIGEGHSVRFIQPGRDAAALNRVLGSEISKILGTLDANGQVFVINPNGVLFGANAQVNAGALVASTLGITTDDFMAGNYRFEGDSNSAVINQGDIRAAQGGYVALVAARIENSGSIAADGGAVLMGAGRKVRLDLGGPIKLEVEEAALDALIEQGGAIRADGGLVYLSAKAAGDLASTVINHSGVTQARSIQAGENGEILLLGEGGVVHVAGQLDASAPEGGDGGFIETSGPDVRIADGVQVTTAAAEGKTGTWLIDPTDFTVSAGEGGQTTSGIGAETLSFNLENNNVHLQTSSDGAEAGDIYVDAAVSWYWGNTLTLDAHNAIHINADINANGYKAGLALKHGAGGDYHLNYAAKVTLSGSASSFSVNGNAYTVVWDLVGLQNIDQNRGGRYVLGRDIDASATASLGGGAGFVPLGPQSTQAFSGHFDGLGHSISDITINRSTATNNGLFGTTQNADIRNVTLKNPAVEGGTRTGALVGEAEQTSIRNVSVLGGSVKGTFYASGLVGSLKTNSTLDNAFSSATVNSASNFGGGLVGMLTASAVSNSYTHSLINYTGGNGQIGGLVGYMTSGTIQDSYASGYLKNGAKGGVTGRKEGGSVTNAYWDTATSGTSSSSGWGAGGGAGLITTELLSGLPAGFDPTIWGIVPGQSYPYLLRQFPRGAVPQVVSGTVSGPGRAGIEVQGKTGGSALTSALTAGSVHAGANGYYHYLLEPGTFTGSQKLLTYVDSGSFKSASFADDVSGSLLDFNLTDKQLTMRTPLPLWSSSLASLQAETGSSGALHTLVDGLDSLSITVAGPFAIDESIHRTGSISLAASGAVELNPSLATQGGAITITSSGAFNTGAGSSITTNGGNFTSTSNGANLKGIIQTGAGNLSMDGSGSGLHLNGADLSTTDGTLSLSTNKIELRDGAKLSTVDGAIELSGSSWIATFETSGDVAITASGQGNISMNSRQAALRSGIRIEANGGDISFNVEPYFELSRGSAIHNPNGTVTIIKTGTETGYIKDFYGSESDKGYGQIIAGKLEIRSNHNVQLTGGSHQVDVLAANVDGWLELHNSGALKIGSVGATHGVTAGEKIIITTQSGDLSVEQNVSTSDASADALVLNAGRGATAGDSTGGNLLVSGGAISTGAGGRATLYTGSLADSSGVVGAAGGSGSGRFRYNSDESASNYSTALGAGNHVIYREQPELTVTLGSASGQYGDMPDPSEMGYSVSGFVNGDSGGVSGAISYSTDATAASNVGSYGITYTGELSSALGYALVKNSNAGGEYTVTRRVLNLTGSRTYNGSEAVAADILALNNLVGSETLTLSGSGSMANMHAGDGKTVTFDTLSLDDDSGLASNYTLVGGVHAVDIAKAAVTFSSSDVSKAYDGTTAAAGTAVVAAGTLFGDTISGGDFAFTNKNVGTGKTVTVSNVTINDGNGGNNYAVSYADNTSSVITQRELNLSGSRTYNGSETLAADIFTLNNLVGGESLALSGSGSMADRHVGDGKDVTLGTLSLGDGSSLAENYTLTGGTVDISQAALAFSSSDVSKVYDGTTDADGSLVITAGTLFGSDSFSGGDFAFANKNAGTGKAVTVSNVIVEDGNSGGNYAVSYADNTSSEITQRELKFTGSRSYNGNTVLAAGIFTLNNLLGSETLTLTGNGSMADKHVGDDKAVTLGSLSLGDGSGLAENYTLTGGTVDISQAALTLSSSDVSKAYDGTTAANGAAIVTAGTLFGDIISGGDFAFTDKNASTGKTVTVSNVTVEDGIGGGNYAVSYADNTTSVIAQRTLNLTGSRTYNGNTVLAADVFTLNNLLGSETLTLSGNGSMDDKHVGDGKTVSIGDLGLGNDSGLASNYTLVGGTHAVDIAKADLTLSSSDVSKAYDGTTAAAGTAVVTAGTLFGDTISGGDFAFIDKNAGTGKTVTVSNVAINDGNSGGNYSVSYTDNTSSVIAQRALNLTGSRTYNGNTELAAGIFTFGNLLGGETLTLLGSGSMADKHVGDAKLVTLDSLSFSGAPDLVSNYTLTGGTHAVDITKADLTLSSSDVSKAYDGTTDAIGSAIITAGVMFDGDTINGGDFAFTDKNVGTGKTIIVSNVAINDGNNGGNYAVSYVDNTSSVIAQRALNLTGSRTYNGNTELAADIFTLTNFIGGESLTLSGSGSMADKHVGHAKAINLDSLSLSGAPDLLSNYSLTGGTVNISKAALTLTSSDVSKIYDGTTAANGTAIITAGALFGGDSFSGGKFTFADKNVGTGKTVTVSNIVIKDGNSGGNYAVSYADNSSSAITQRVLSLNGNRAYNGSAVLAADVFTLANLAQGETLRLTGSGSMGDRHVGENKTVTLGSLGLANAEGLASNYTLVGGTHAVAISKADLTLSSSDVSKTYDGTAAANGAAIITGGALFGSDSFSGGDFAFADKNAGTGKVVTVDNVVISDGNGGGNYAVSYADNATSLIKKRVVTVSGITAADKIYDGDITAAIDVSQAHVDNLVNGDQLTVATDGHFDNSHAGENKTVHLYSRYDGADHGNYEITDQASTTADITQRPISVIADEQRKAYGADDPTLTWQISAGDLMGDDQLNGELERELGERIGEYRIDRGSLEHGDYAIDFEPGILHIDTVQELDSTVSNIQSVLAVQTNAVQSLSVLAPAQGGPLAVNEIVSGLVFIPIELPDGGDAMNTAGDASAMMERAIRLPTVAQAIGGRMSVFVISGGIRMPYDDWE